MSSSETKASPTPLPITPPAIGVVKISSPLWIILPNLDKLATFPALFASKALLAKLAARSLLAVCTPIWAPLTAGSPICVKACVIRPTVLASAVSSKGLIVSKNCSTLAADSVPNPRSISSAPSEKIPLGILIKPDPTPAKADVMKCVSSSFFFLAAAVTPYASS